jgi:Alpha-glutamyl/putrescinyl thymine pyrophosphorylase clade 3
MPNFCRHGRFLERCPICSKSLPGSEPGDGSAPRSKGSRGPRSSGSTGTVSHSRRVRGASVRVRREGRAEDDGYSSSLIPGVRASADAQRLAEEIAFSSARLLALAADPPDLYGEMRVLAETDVEQASWICFMAAYLSPLEGEDPFAGIRQALATTPDGCDRASGELPDLTDVAPGPRTSHDPARGTDTLVAYRQWVQRSGGSQAIAFAGDAAWTPQRRFERLHERLALPGFGRTGRYDLLVTLGRLGLYELHPGSLHLTGAPADDLTTLGAKRVFGIGDPLLLERRAAVLAEAASVPIEALDLALANWAAPQRATLGFPQDSGDSDAYERAGSALGL